MRCTVPDHGGKRAVGPEVRLCCPRCRAALDEEAQRLRCAGCGAAYPVIAGIPDLRVCPDPYISLERDRRKAQALARAAGAMSFAELVDHYYAITPEVPADLAARYARHHRAGVARGQGVLRRLRARFGIAPADGHSLLDLGCGSAGLVAAVAGGAGVVGVDVALRWLVIGRRRLEEAGLGGARLVCACADHLPFAAGCFDWLVAENLLEHLADAEAALAEALRVARPGARFHARTVNRYLLAREPHVGLWGVGFLPRRWMDPYVRWRRGLPYDRIHLRSAGELRRLARRAGADGLRVQPPLVDDADVSHLGPTQRRWLRAYGRLGALLPGRLLTPLAPWLDVAGRLAAAPGGNAGG